MARFAKRNGEQVEVEGQIRLDAKGLERVIDMTILYLLQQGWGQRKIARFLNRSQANISDRLRAIPPAARAYLEAQGSKFFGPMPKEEPAVIVNDADHSQAVEVFRTDIDDSPETVERLVDVLALALHDLGLKPCHIGYVVGLTEPAAKRRIQEIPDEVRAFAVATQAQLW